MLGTELVWTREDLGMTQQELGEALGVSERLIRYWESGARRIPRKHQRALQALCQRRYGPVRPMRPEACPRAPLSDDDDRLLQLIKQRRRELASEFEIQVDEIAYHEGLLQLVMRRPSTLGDVIRLAGLDRSTEAGLRAAHAFLLELASHLPPETSPPPDLDVPF